MQAVARGSSSCAINSPLAWVGFMATAPTSLTLAGGVFADLMDRQALIIRKLLRAWGPSLWGVLVLMSCTFGWCLPIVRWLTPVFGGPPYMALVFDEAVRISNAIALNSTQFQLARGVPGGIQII